jgi:Mg2+-importing ATPase
MILFCLAIPYLGPAASVFGFAPISAKLLIAAILIASSYLVATEMMKRWFYRRIVR